MRLLPSGESGSIRGRYPYARAGDGRRPLLVVPGLGDALWDGGYPSAAARVLGWYFAAFLDTHTVSVVSRPRGLPEGHSIADMTEGYGRVLADELGPADVLGVSMGGMVAQELAIGYPDLVDRLVLANTGCRFGDLDALDRFDAYARDRDWAAIRAELSGAMFTDVRALVYPPLALTLGRLALPRPADPADVEVSLAAVRAFDSRDRLDDVEAPTLVFGGSDDPYFPREILEETAAGIPHARTAFAPGAKHGAFHERKATFDARVESFFRQTEPNEAAGPSAGVTR